MALVLNGSGITSANIADGTIVNADVADVAASKLTGALPAIDGSALTNLPASGLGVGQTWAEVTGSRVAGTTYTNSTGKPIFINITPNTNNSYDGNVWVGSIKIGNYYTRSSSTAKTNISFIVPNGSTYRFTCTIGFGVWSELR